MYVVGCDEIKYKISVIVFTKDSENPTSHVLRLRFKY